MTIWTASDVSTTSIGTVHSAAVGASTLVSCSNRRRRSSSKLRRSRKMEATSAFYPVSSFQLSVSSLLLPVGLMEAAKRVTRPVAAASSPEARSQQQWQKPTLHTAAPQYISVIHSYKMLDTNSYNCYILAVADRAARQSFRRV